MSWARISLVLVAAFAFGLVAAAVQGEGGVEVRNMLVHLSTPWLLVAFLAGTRCSTLRSGALLGLGATIAALGGFYLLASIVQDLGGHGFFGDLRFELSANRGYLQGGIVTGPLFGALGAWWARSRKLHASVVAGVLLMAEPIVLALIAAVGPNEVLSADTGLPLVVRLVPGSGLTTDAGSTAFAVYAAEFVAGLALVLLAALAWPRWRTSSGSAQ